MVITRQAQSPPVEVIIIPHSSFLIPHFSFLIPHSSFLIYYSLTSGTT